MEFTKLNLDWDADPNVPDVKVTVIDDTVLVEFDLNYFEGEQFKEGDRGRLKFIGCHKYSSNGPNDEGYYKGQHRYKYTDLPWGDFYKLETNWRLDFPDYPVFLSRSYDDNLLSHYLFFFRESTFECVAWKYELEFLLS